MTQPQSPTVAVLIATYNGEKYIESQLRSLLQNSTAIELHWLDDHSTDATRQVVRDAARELGIRLHEWHQPERLGVPATFLQLLECAQADIYLFCDQDDIWQPGKIDATVQNLTPDLALPALCFSDPLMFYDDEPEVFYRISEVLDMKPPASLQASRALLASPAAGQAIGFTRPLRDLFMSHKEIARKHAVMHSWWMYLLAVSVGRCRMLTEVPTTLYRRHGTNVSAAFFGNRNQRSLQHFIAVWKLQRWLRQSAARQAKGFILAAPTLPPSPALQLLLSLAPHVATLDRRQSLSSLLSLARRAALLPSRRRSFWLMAACLCTNART